MLKLVETLKAIGRNRLCENQVTYEAKQCSDNFYYL